MQKSYPSQNKTKLVKSTCTRKVSFFFHKIFFSLSVLLMAFACKSYHSWQNMSSFWYHWTELWPKSHFRLFLIIFVLFVLDSLLVMLDHPRRPLKVTFYPYNKFRTQKVRSNDWKLSKSKKSFKHVWAPNTWFRPIFFQFYLIGEDARP